MIACYACFESTLKFNMNQKDFPTYRILGRKDLTFHLSSNWRKFAILKAITSASVRQSYHHFGAWRKYNDGVTGGELSLSQESVHSLVEDTHILAKWYQMEV